jgi:hypothetical protein
MYVLHWYSTTVVPLHVGQHLQHRQNLQQKRLSFEYSGCGGLVSAIGNFVVGWQSKLLLPFAVNSG